MMAELGLSARPHESLITSAARWSLAATPRTRSIIAALAFVTLGVSALVHASAPVAATGTAAIGLSALSLVLSGMAAETERDRPRRLPRLLRPLLLAIAVAAAVLAGAALLLALLGKPWLS